MVLLRLVHIGPFKLLPLFSFYTQINMQRFVMILHGLITCLCAWTCTCVACKAHKMFLCFLVFVIVRVRNSVYNRTWLSFDGCTIFPFLFLFQLYCDLLIDHLSVILPICDPSRTVLSPKNDPFDPATLSLYSLPWCTY